ncbi:hypothetical protein [uncultured Hyphomicrobium sp.]|jgi:hypothetical protein|uniref:hypothetical protein n=1 Tax=uncultured Hyphomicrobium sp. TaxID=194373 RepID=UPI0025DB543D|nr:hypothetical protein [uncultured Hyphomicrobium sp.]
MTILVCAVPVVLGLCCLLGTVGCYLERRDHVPNCHLDPPIYGDGHEIIAAGMLDAGPFQLLMSPAAGYVSILTRVIFDAAGRVKASDSIAVDRSEWGYVNIGTYRARVIRIKCGMGLHVAWFDTPRITF